jgi:hypothetical protein
MAREKINLKEKEMKNYKMVSWLEPVKQNGTNVKTIKILPKQKINSAKVLKIAQAVLKKAMENDKVNKFEYQINPLNDKGLFQKGRVFRAVNHQMPDASVEHTYWTTSDGSVIDSTARFTSFYIYVIDGGAAVGGKSENNDCLYLLLKNLSLTKFPWKSAAVFKKFLGLKRDDMVPISMMPIIDAKLKTHRIYCYGDHTYASTKQSGIPIEIQLVKEHYSYFNHAYDKIYMSHKEKLPYLYIKGKNQVEIYNGIDKDTIPIKEFDEWKDGLDRKYMSLDAKHVDVQNVQDIFLIYDNYIKMAEELKTVTNGKINLYKTGLFTTTAYALFMGLNRNICPDEIDQLEADFLRSCKNCGLMYAEKGYSGEGYKNDFISMYPSIMRDNKFLVPIKKPEFKRLDELPEVISFGIYRVHITNAPHLFPYNPLNYYTHIEVNFARKHNSTIELIHDTKENAMIYLTRINSHQLFREYVDMLYELKKKKVMGAKIILTCLWGYLCKQRYYDKNVKSTDDEFPIPEGNNIIGITTKEDGVCVRYHQTTGNNYFSAYARLGPFLTARARCKTLEVLVGHQDQVVWLHTDGFITKTQLPLKTGTEMGELKYEGYCPNVYIKNLIHKEGEFIV